MLFNNSSEISHNGEGKELYDAIECYSVMVWRIYLTNGQHITLGICLGFTILPIVALNFALSFGLYKVGGWRNKSKFFIYILSISDVIFGLFTVPANVVLVTLLGSERNCLIEKAFLFVGQINGHFSFYSIMAIALERYLNITAALQYGVESQGIKGKLTRLISTTRGHCTCLILMLLLSTLHGLAPTYFFGKIQSNIPNIFMAFVRFAILATIYILYIRMYLILKKHVSANQQLNQRHTKVFRTVLTILIVYTVCYLPFVLTDFATSYYSYVKKSAAPNSLRFIYYLSFTLVYLNAAINAGVLLKANKHALAYNCRLISALCPCLNLQAKATDSTTAELSTLPVSPRGSRF